MDNVYIERVKVFALFKFTIFDQNLQNKALTKISLFTVTFV
jgi:hypothetical protein